MSESSGKRGQYDMYFVMMQLHLNLLSWGHIDVYWNGQYI